MHIAAVRKLTVAFILIWALAGTARAAAAKAEPLAIGAAAPDFKLPGVDGKDHALADYKDAKVLVVVFTCNHCPTAQSYEERLIGFYKDYHDKGVALVAINPNDPKAVRLDEMGYTDLGDTMEELKLRAAEKKFPYPYLDDGGQGQKTARAYGALATPHVFVFDADRNLRYQGRFDDGKYDVRDAKSHDARDAVDALLGGKAPAVTTTKVFGCATKWSAATATPDSRTRETAKWDNEEVTVSPLDTDAIKTLIANRDGDGAAPYRLVNVWATWCGPCVTEMPELSTILHMYRRRPFEFVTISVDEAGAKDEVLKVLKENHLSAKNYMYAGKEFDALVAAVDPKEWDGPLPYTLFIAPGGKVLYRSNGAIDPRELKRVIADNLGRSTKGAHSSATRPASVPPPPSARP
jgi:thiol-disulfide isomerase/thioredoxin